MAADLTTVTKRVIDILDANLPRTFTATVSPAALKRNTDAISEAIREGALMIAQAVVANKNHVHRNLYISGTATALTHGGELPDMAGEGDLIEIQRYSGGSYTPGVPRDAQQIASYRLNPSSVYGSAAHTVQNSPLAGYYAMSRGRFYFTGNAAQGYFPAISRSTATSLVADEYEGIWVCLSVGLSPKDGIDASPLTQYFMNIGAQGLAAITEMGVIAPMPPIDLALQSQVARGNV